MQTFWDDKNFSKAGFFPSISSQKIPLKVPGTIYSFKSITIHDE